MKFKNIVIVFFVAIIFPSAYINKNSVNPEKALFGEWKELSWDYERLNDKEKLLGTFIGNKEENIRVHTAEIWTFKPNGILILSKNGQETINQWAIKGRGNILEIKSDEITEHYDITTLNGNKIELNYMSDIQIKGAFGKLIFEKI